jgi:glycosyltransferase involved in cell wall biosynthesis
MSIKLTILICTLDTRIDDFKILLESLKKQPYYRDIEVLWIGDNKKRLVGRKRNDLLRLAQGDYICFVDDDDKITPDYIQNLLEGIKLGMDVVNFDVECSVNGGVFKKVYYDANYKSDKNFPGHYERIPNHLMCVKRELAMKAGFPEKQFAEDQVYAARLLPFLKTQARIKKTMYYYVFNHKKSETQ